MVVWHFGQRKNILNNHRLMQPKIEITKTETGVRYELPYRKTSSFKKLGMGLLVFGFFIAGMFVFQMLVLGGVGRSFLLDLWLAAGLCFAGIWVWLGVRLLTNSTRQVIELNDNVLTCKEILWSKMDWAIPVSCQASEITSFTIESTDLLIGQIDKTIPGNLKIMKPGTDAGELRVVHALSAAGRELSFAHFYPATVVNDLSQALLTRLGDIVVPVDSDLNHGVEVIQSVDSVRYIMPQRKFGFARYLAILPMIPTALLLCAMLPGWIACLSGGIIEFIVFSVALLIPIAICALVFGLGYRVLRNQSRCEIELKNEQLWCYEQIFTKFLRISSKCKTATINSLDVIAFESTKKDLGPARFLAILAPDTFLAVARTNAGDLIIGRAYPFETIKFVADDIKARLNLSSDVNHSVNPVETETRPATDTQSATETKTEPKVANPFVVDMDIQPQSEINQ